MNWSWHMIVAFSVLAAGTVLPGATVAQQATSATQVLDRVNAVSPKAVLDMAFDDPADTAPFETPPEIITERGFTSCQLTAERGLFCLDQNTAGAPGRFVRRWDPVFRDGEVGNPYFSCESLPGVDTSRGVETCTGITADDNGAVVVAGKRKGGYNLIKVAPLADLGVSTCSNAPNGPWVTLANTNGLLCYKVLLPRDRPLLVDVTYAELIFPNDGTGKSVQCTGILGLENRTTLMFFTDRDAGEKNHPSCATTYAEVTIVDTKGWGLDRGEVLQGVTTLKTKAGASEDSFVLVISNLGRVRAEKTNDPVVAPFRVAISRGTTGYTSVAALRDSRGMSDAGAGEPAVPCDTSSQEFGIRTSTKSGRLYVSDENFCEVSAFEPAGATLVKDGDGLKVATFVGRDLVLSTRTEPAGTAYPVVEPTLAPGISIDLSKCASADGCTFVASGDGQSLATLSNVRLASTAKGMTLFQVQNVPDCRWIQDAPGCTSATVSGGTAPETQYLNITPLLPKEVTDQFAPGELKPMYISPQYRAQKQNDFYFEVFFGVTQKGVVFQDVFNLEFEVGLLNAADRGELGCVATPSLKTPVADLLAWDISVTVSEKVKVVGSTDQAFSDMLVNNGCGSLKSGAVRWSAYMYDLELTPNVYGGDAGGPPPDDYFAHLAVDLFFDLEAARSEFACNGPLATAVCRTLESSWLNAKDKLTKCLKDSYAPKTSEAVRNCNSLDTQLANYRATLNTVPSCTVSTTTCRDPENRLGELKARVDTLRHVINDRLIPSVPESGWFVDELPVLDDDGNLKNPNQ